MIDFVLLGTSHCCQESPDFLACVERTIRNYSIALIAEEFNFDASIRSAVNGLAAQSKIPYLQIDIPVEDWAKFDIEIEMSYREQHLRGKDYRLRHADDIRENYWIDQIENYPAKGTTLIICGYLHIQYLAEKIQMRKYQTRELKFYPEGLAARSPERILEPDKLKAR